MSSPDPNQAIREATRAVLREMVPELVRELSDGDGNGNGNGNGNGHAQPAHTGDEIVVPQVPAPPVAAVLRPSTWDRPAAPGEVIGAPAGEPQLKISGDDARVETVKIDTDEDLERFIRELITRLENPRDRLAIRKGQLRFVLGRSETVGQPKQPASVRVKKGAVTERVIRQAASAGTRLVLEPGAVLTPLARDEAKALGVQIERERRC